MVIVLGLSFIPSVRPSVCLLPRFLPSSLIYLLRCRFEPLPAELPQLVERFLPSVVGLNRLSANCACTVPLN